ncbi:MAG: heavy metal translocating P-type ATPase, partial [Deltaproteobacteria bacterium]|nr:heavy metal translocating P-type ATPase [Deltaproteobacteria bacterium]
IARLKDDIARLLGVRRVEETGDGTTLLIEFDPGFTTLEVIQSYVVRQGLRIKSHYGHEHYVIEGLDCPDCALKLEQALAKIPGVTWVSINFTTSKIWFEYEPEEVNREQILAAISRAGYRFREPEIAAVAPEASASSFQIKGLDCPDCAAKLQKRISLLEGVHEASLNYASATLLVRHDTEKTGRADILAAVEDAGYQANLKAGDTTEPGAGFFSIKNQKLFSTILSGSLIALAYAALLLGRHLHLPHLTVAGQSITPSHLLYLLAIFTGGYHVARSGYYSLIAKTFDMNFLMSAAVIGALGIGELEEGAMVVFLFSLGNTLQSYTMDKARNALRSLMDLAPKEAHLKKGGRLLRVPVSDIKIGDLVIVKPGEKVPVDGSVVQGSSPVNQSPITGESQPVDKGPGDPLFAGSINGSGSLEVRVEKPAADSTLARIINLVEEAQAQKAPSQTFIDAFSKIYTPLVIVSAAAVSVIPPLLFSAPFTEWFYRGLMLLIISCPCALVLSTPVSIVSAIACASRNGILIKGGAYLEEMGAIGAIAFDKTGTVTSRRFLVTDVIGMRGENPGDILTAAASLEMKSEHPLAKAIVKHAQQEGLVFKEPPGLITYPGMGAQAMLDGSQALIGNCAFFLERGIDTTPYDGELTRLENEGKTAVLVHYHSGSGIIALADTVRQQAGSCIEELRRQGIRHMVMLSGDNDRVSSSIARVLKVDGYKAALLPDQKVDAVRELLFKYEKVAMVGDGVNDAPALAVSSVGIAMGAAGSDAAIEAADIALMADDLLKLPFLVHLSRRTLSTIKTNIAFSLTVKAAFIVTVLLGWANLWMAVTADMGTSLLVIVYGMRLMVTRRGLPSSSPSPTGTTERQSSQPGPSCNCAQ